MAEGNPFWDIHNALWGMLEDETKSADLVAAELHFVNLVDERNRIKYIETAKDLEKRTTAAGDFPEVAIVSTGFKFHDRFDSNDDQIIVEWGVYVSTGEQPFGGFFDVQWAVFRQLQGWEAALQDTLTWKSEKYVRDSDLLTAEDSLDRRELNRLIKGWSSVWACQTACHFSHSKVIV